MKKSSLWILPLVLTLSASVSMAADKKGSSKKQPVMDEKAMMEAWMKAGTPSDAHKSLDPMVGSWSVTMKSWMKPADAPMESKGTAVNKWVLGGRHIEHRYDGEFMGQPFSGIGYTGYDNITKKYVGSWMDTMSTSVMLTTGKWETAGKTMTFSGTMNDPITGKAMPFKEKVTVIDADHHTMEMWGPGPDGKMFKNMELHYTRK